MPYIPDLHQVQIGKEITWGTAVTCTAKLGLIESCEFSADIEGNTLPDVRASLAPGYVQTLDSHKASGKISGVATYEDLQYYLDSLLGIVTPTGAGPYIYASAAPLGSVPTCRMMTINYGQTGAVKKIAGAICNELTIKLEPNKPWTFDASFVGKSVVDGTLAALSDRTQTPIHSNVSTLYLDAWGGTIGTTAITSAWMSAELNIKSNLETLMGIGSLTPATYRGAKYEGSLKLNLEADAVSGGYLTSILGSSLLQQQARLKATTGATAIAQFDFAGGHLAAPKFWSDTDGIVTAEFELSGLYNTGLANWLKASMTNSVSVLP